MKVYDYLSDCEEEALLQLTGRIPSELDQETLDVEEAAEEDSDDPGEDGGQSDDESDDEGESEIDVAFGHFRAGPPLWPARATASGCLLQSSVSRMCG